MAKSNMCVYGIQAAAHLIDVKLVDTHRISITLQKVEIGGLSTKY